MVRTRVLPSCRSMLQRVSILLKWNRHIWPYCNSIIAFYSHIVNNRIGRSVIVIITVWCMMYVAMNRTSMVTSSLQIPVGGLPCGMDWNGIALTLAWIHHFTCFNFEQWLALALALTNGLGLASTLMTGHEYIACVAAAVKQSSVVYWAVSPITCFISRLNIIDTLGLTVRNQSRPTKLVWRWRFEYFFAFVFRVLVSCASFVQALCVFVQASSFLFFHITASFFLFLLLKWFCLKNWKTCSFNKTRYLHSGYR